MSFYIVTDSCTDFPLSYLKKQKELSVFPLTYQLDGVSHVPTGEDKETLAFYGKMREGKVATTSQINVQTWKDAFERLLKEGHDVLAVVFSSALSGTANAAMVAKKELKDKYPERAIRVVDSLSASLGEGMAVFYALKCRDEDGMSLAETAAWMEENRKHFCQWFTVDDLKYLKRGGRISATAAFVAGALNIKPVMHVDNEGRLTSVKKVQGRKKSLRALVDRMKETAIAPEKQTMFITHGDAEKDALVVKELIEKELNPKNVMVSLVGPVIGSHSGPGTIAVFWFGTER